MPVWVVLDAGTARHIKPNAHNRENNRLANLMKDNYTTPQTEPQSENIGFNEFFKRAVKKKNFSVKFKIRIENVIVK